MADYVANNLIYNRRLVSPEVIAHELKLSSNLSYISHISIYNAIWREGSTLNETQAFLAQRGIRRRRRRPAHKPKVRI